MNRRSEHDVSLTRGSYRTVNERRPWQDASRCGVAEADLEENEHQTAVTSVDTISRVFARVAGELDVGRDGSGEGN